MGLLELQRGLKAHMLHGDPEITMQIRGDDPAIRLRVYDDACRAQLVACLRDAYEKTWAWLGDEAFDAAARHHIATCRPSRRTPGGYGAAFTETLGELYPDDPEVVELAWLDGTLRRAFEGPDAEPISPEALAAVDWDNAILVFVPTVAIAEVTTNCVALWSAIAGGETPPAVERLPEPAAIRVWRQGFSPRYRTIKAPERRALEMTKAGVPFGAACALLAEDLGEARAARIVGALLASWVRDGLVSAVHQAADSYID
ncbi:MAG: DNA-binding domain-containing protein [Caulobacteraceae bacterium]